ncbi:MAG: BTAD domain-containing putative transcriptional regulator [Solirubrobacteraceae bacterium]
MYDLSTSRLPSYHVRRARLTDACSGERVVVVEAAGGYGKSVFGTELVDAWGALPIWVLLEEGEVSAQLLASRLRAAVARSGLSDAAAAMAAAGDDPAGAVDDMLSGLAGESSAIVIDDAHHAARDAARLIDRIASQLAGTQRLVVLARRLPPGLERLRRADAAHLDAGDLALRAEETLELCRSGFALDVSADDVRILDAGTGGWTAAAVLAASRAKRTAQPLRAIAAVRGRADGSTDAVGLILEELLNALGSEQVRLAQIARLPLLDREILAAVTGDPGFFDRSLALGLPLTPTGNGWWELPGPVRDHLATLGGPDPDALQRAAEYYERRGNLGAALALLLGAGEVETAARLLADADPRQIDSIEALELLSVIDRIPPAVLDEFPSALLHVARSCHSANLLQQRSRLLARLGAAADEHEEPELRRAIDVETAVDLSLGGTTPIEAEALARRVLASARTGEQLTRARALSVMGKARWWQCDADGRRSIAGMREAADYFNQSADILLGLGQHAAVAALAPYRAIWIELELGRPQAALEILGEGLTLSVGVPRRYSSVLFFRAKVLTELGRHEESRADLEEVLRIARQLPDPANKVAYVHWERFILASMRGDAAETLHHVRQTEAHRADWWEHGRSDFFAEAADCLDRVGEVPGAWEYLERVRADQGDADRLIAMAECALLARHGDPVLAEDRLDRVDRRGLLPREYWRVTLLRAYAALRRGETSAGGLAARAFEAAAQLGQPQLPLIRERELTEALLSLAVETGSPAANALDSSSLPYALGLLGRFELTRGGRTVSLRPGQGPQLLKLIAVSGGKVQAERAIEALWPEVDPDAGRNRLRTVLGRLRDSAPEVVTRDGDLLALGEDVRLDVAQFAQDARRARALATGNPTAAVAIARSAIARYRGPLLPHDPYADWAEEPRESARRTMLDLLDLCAEAATDSGDLDEARRMVERTIELAPYDDDRYLRVALILHEQGRKGAALSVLRRARSALTQIGIDPPRQLSELERTIAAAGARPVDAGSMTPASRPYQRGGSAAIV